MNTIKLNTLGDKVIVRKAAENGGNAGGDTGGSGGGNMLYIRNTNDIEFNELSGLFLILITGFPTSVIRAETTQGTWFLTVGYALEIFSTNFNMVTGLAAGFPLNTRLSNTSDGSIQDVTKEFLFTALEQQGISSYTEITEEEFYNTSV